MVVTVHSDDGLRHEVFSDPGRHEDGFTLTGSTTRVYTNHRAFWSIFLTELQMLYTIDGPMRDVGNIGGITSNQDC